MTAAYVADILVVLGSLGGSLLISHYSPGKRGPRGYTGVAGIPGPKGDKGEPGDATPWEERRW